MKSNKYIGLLCLATLLATFFALPTTVSATPGLTLIKYKPSSNYYGGWSTPPSNPAQAYDWNNATAAQIRPGQVASAYFAVTTFVVASGYTAPPDDRNIAFVDVCMTQSGGGNAKGAYRILLQIGGSAIVLADWASTTYGSITLRTWLNQPDPSSPAWTWDSLPPVEVYFDTKDAGGGGGTPTMSIYEVWLNVYYYRQSTMSVQTPSGKQRTPFTVNINITDADSLYGWEFELTYNNAYLTATSVTNGTFFPVGKHPNFWSLEVNDTAGRVRAACSLIGDYVGQDGSGVLAVVSFSVKAPFPPEPQLLVLQTTKLVGYDYGNKRTFNMLHTAVDGTVLLSIRDVLIVSVVPESMLAFQGYTRDIDVTVRNDGDLTETFNVTAYYGSYRFNETRVAGLLPGNTVVVTFTWNTTGIPYGIYEISAQADEVPFETFTANNIGSGGDVLLTIPGDVNGDKTVNVFDLLKIKDHRSGPPPGPGGYNADADINNDDSINVFDILIAKSHLGQSW